ncbi:MAG: GntR family transcriptional regulator [Hoeflea sp. BRH_c9]|nr:MAG: GntR family transcriptional regulator [Hoeflea sp. BRH_c9]
MKSDTVYKRTFNQMLDLIQDHPVGAALPSETVLASELGASRTTIRKVIDELCAAGLLRFEARRRIVLSHDCGGLYHPVVETVSASDRLEKLFMEWMLRGDAKPGTAINEAEMARRFGISTTGIREFLNRFSRFGLVERRPGSGWVFKGFSESFASELFEIREMFELRSALAFCRLPREEACWKKLGQIEQEHHALLADIETRFHDFSDLDDRFHRLVIHGAPNRFIEDFYDIITFVFHYHYQWNKKSEKQRNRTAIVEHLRYIEALRSGDEATVDAACRAHLKSARLTLFQSMINETAPAGTKDNGA